MVWTCTATRQYWVVFYCKSRAICHSGDSNHSTTLCRCKRVIFSGESQLHDLWCGNIASRGAGVSGLRWKTVMTSEQRSYTQLAVTLFRRGNDEKKRRGKKWDDFVIKPQGMRWEKETRLIGVAPRTGSNDSDACAVRTSSQQRVAGTCATDTSSSSLRNKTLNNNYPNNTKR